MFVKDLAHTCWKLVSASFRDLLVQSILITSVKLTDKRVGSADWTTKSPTQTVHFQVARCVNLIL